MSLSFLLVFMRHWWPTMISFWSVSIAHKPYFSLILISTIPGNTDISKMFFDSQQQIGYRPFTHSKLSFKRSCPTSEIQSD